MLISHISCTKFSLADILWFETGPAQSQGYRFPKASDPCGSRVWGLLLVSCRFMEIHHAPYFGGGHLVQK